MLGQHRHSGETTFKWRFAGVPMLHGPLIVVFGSFLPKKKKKNIVKVGPPLIKLSGSAHDNIIQM